MNEEELSNRMHDALPDRPDVRTWADGARRRARRRRISVAGAALVVVAAIAAPLALQNNRDTAPPVVLATPSPTSETTRQLVPDACQDPATGAAPLVDGELPDGAERVWLCGGEDTRSEITLVGAPDPLVARAEEAVTAFNSLQTETGVRSCPRDPGWRQFTVVVEYPDGVHRTITAEQCGGLVDVAGEQGIFHYDATYYFETLDRLWAEQRAETDFAFTGVQGLCDTSHASIHRPLRLANVTRVLACADLPDGTREVVRLPSALTEELLSSVQTHASAWASEVGIGGGPPSLVLLTEYGDPISVFSYPLSTGEDQSENAFIWNDGTTNMLWRLPQDLQDDIQDLVDAHVTSAQTIVPEPSKEAPTPPVEPLEGLEREVCAGIPTVDVGIENLPRIPTSEVPKLDGGAARVWLCGHGSVGPVEPLTTDPDRAVDAISALPTARAGQACTADIGTYYSVVIEYPNGSQRAVRAASGGCQEVKFGEVRTGGRALLEQLKGFWVSQREATQATFTEQVDLCTTMPMAPHDVALNSIFDVERPSLQRGVICGLPEGAGVNAVPVQRDLPPELVSAISQAVGDGTDQASWSPGMPVVVLLNAHGDPLTIRVTDDLKLVLDGGTWKPGGELATQWIRTFEGLRTTPV